MLPQQQEIKSKVDIPKMPVPVAEPAPETKKGGFDFDSSAAPSQKPEQPAP